MAWTAPRTWVAAENVTAALMNTHVRDNLLETAPAKVTTQGDTVYATAANALTRLAIGASGTILRSTGTVPEWADPADGAKLDGDTIDIDGTPVNYTPSAVAPASDADDLWAHLLGIDNALGTLSANGVAKGWVGFDTAGTIDDSFNTTASVTDNGTGSWTITWDTDFANAAYAVVTGIAPGADTGFIVIVTARAVGTTTVKTLDVDDGATIAENTGQKVFVAAFGDQ